MIYNIYLAVLNVRYLKGFLVTTRWISATSDWTEIPGVSVVASLSGIVSICGCKLMPVPRLYSATRSSSVISQTATILVTVLFSAPMEETDLFLILTLSLDKIFVKYSFVRCPIVHDMCQERKLFITPLALLYIQKICNFLWAPFSC